MTENKRYATLADAARYLSVHVDTIRRLIASGDLPSYRVCRRILVDLNELDAYASRYARAS